MKKNMLSNIHIILVNTTHPGNIGAVARAMKNMGLSRLTLVGPKCFPHKEAIIRASGADDLLRDAVVVDDLKTAIADCEVVYGTSARLRRLETTLMNPRECASHIMQTPERKIALVFGREHAGLTNEELALCQYHIHIPTVENFSSLNLAQAVQVVVYELRLVYLSQANDLPQHKRPQLANQQQLQGFYDHLKSVLEQTQFLNPAHPKLLMRRLTRLFNRAELEEKEIHILRGALAAIEQQLQKVE
jgi:tRNA (cytidine32/uridine32-2'-O)-methyltransferase